MSSFQDLDEAHEEVCVVDVELQDRERGCSLKKNVDLYDF